MFGKKLLSVLVAISILISMCSPALASEIVPEISEVDAASAIVLDTGTGEIMFEQNADEPRAPASITKIITSLLVLECVDSGTISLEDRVTVTDEMINSIPADASRMMISIESGEVFSIKDLLYANMVSSDCFASNILAFVVSGSIGSFCTLMNTRAKELNCTNTNFTNPSGYPDSNMYTTARSMLLITSKAMEYDVFRDIVKTKEYTIGATNINPERKLTNTNRLLYLDDFGAIGVKTGSSTPSGLCLVSAVQRDGITLLSVIMGAHYYELDDGTSVSGSFEETSRMVNECYSTLHYRAVQEEMSGYFDKKTDNIIEVSKENNLEIRDVYEFEIARQEDILLQKKNVHTRFMILIISCICALFIIMMLILSRRRTRY